MILENSVLRASEDLHSSTAQGLADERIALVLERFDFLRCAILPASQAAVSMVVHLGIDGIEACFPLLTHHSRSESAGGLIAAAAGFYTRSALYAFTLGHVRGG
jgi:hypothetical protein